MIKVDRSNREAQKGGAQKGVQFLSPKHVADGKELTCKVVKVTTNKPDNFGNPYVVYFFDGTTKYSKGYSETSDALISLVDMLGEDEKKWVGRTVVVGKELNDSADKESGYRLTYSQPGK